LSCVETEDGPDAGGKGMCRIMSYR